MSVFWIYEVIRALLSSAVVGEIVVSPHYFVFEDANMGTHWRVNWQDEDFEPY